jgi:hypothetical protein
MQARSKSLKRTGYHRTDGHDSRQAAERSKAGAEDRLNRIKESVNAACTAFFTRRGLANHARFNRW